MLGYAMLRVRPIKFHTFTMSDTSTKINSIKSINVITETNDHCNENQHKRRYRLKIIHYAKQLSANGLG